MASLEEVDEILRILGKEMDHREKFYHILEQLGKHIIKLTRLKENEDRPGHFKEEVADVLILAESLYKLEKVDDKTLKAASKHFLEKIKEIYG